MCELKLSTKRNLRLRFILIVLGVLALLCGGFAAEAQATSGTQWIIRELPGSVKPGDQIAPDTDGASVVFRDYAEEPSGMLMRRDLNGWETPLYVAGVGAGPGPAAGHAAWQASDLQTCLGDLTGSSSRCLAVPAASAISLSGERAVTGHSDNIIRLVNFETMRSRILDSSSSSGGRYDPDIDGDRAVWVKERGYAGQYYEPLLVSYDLSTDTATYATSTGGGSNAEGESIYERRHPSLSGGRILYQQRFREPAAQWDIYEAVPGTFGVAAVDEPGDQIRPSLSGNLVVYQDNRLGHPDGDGGWTGEWDIYVTDLLTGIEQPVCIAAGDQTNPVINGNVIVWEDNRSGDWDVYAAEISPIAAQPHLRLSVGSAFWGSYSDYQEGNLSVRYVIANSGPGAAVNVALREVYAAQAGVSVSGALPDPVAVIASGESAVFEVRFLVAPEVRWFRTSLRASCQDEDGRELSFP